MFLVSWFVVAWFFWILDVFIFDFLVSWFLGFLVPKFQSSEVPKIQKSTHVLLEDIVSAKSPTTRLSGFLVSWFLVVLFLGSVVYWLLGSKVSKFRSFKDSKINCMSRWKILPPCFLDDIDLIFRLLKNLLDGSSGFFDTVLSKNRKIFDVQHTKIFQNHIFGKYVGGFF